VTTNPTPDEELIGLEMVRLSPRRYAKRSNAACGWRNGGMT
jgi:hypothetical protein